MRLLRLIAGCFFLIVCSTAVLAGDFRRVVSDYQVTPGKGSGIVRAYYYGPNTVIELDEPPNSFSAVDEEGKNLEFEIEGRFVRMTDRPEVFTATFSSRAATLRSQESIARQNVRQPAPDRTPTIPLAWIDKTTDRSGAKPDAGSAPVKIASAEPDAMKAGSSEAQKPVAVPANDIKAVGGKAPKKSVWRVLASDQWYSNTLKRWATEAGWGVSWEVRDFPVDGAFTPSYEDTFEDAVVKMMLGFSDSDTPTMAILIDDGRNKIVRVVRYEGNSNGKK